MGASLGPADEHPYIQSLALSIEAYSFPQYIFSSPCLNIYRTIRGVLHLALQEDVLGRLLFEYPKGLFNIGRFLAQTPFLVVD